MKAHIRIADKLDCEPICKIHSLAFPSEESDQIAMLAERLLSEVSTPPTLTLVAQVDRELIGHVAFSPVHAMEKSVCIGYILAPLAVIPEYQGIGIGERLVEAGIAQLSATGVHLFLVYGDPKYYGRFGFDAEAAVALIPPFKLAYPFGWLAKSPHANVNVPPLHLSVVKSLRNPQLW